MHVQLDLCIFKEVRVLYCNVVDDENYIILHYFRNKVVVGPIIFYIFGLGLYILFG